MNKKILIASPDKCTGCRTCEIVCQMKNNSSRIKILKNEIFDVNIPTVSINCNLCREKPLCVRFCVADALELVDFDDAAKVRKKYKIGMFPVPITISDRKGGEQNDYQQILK